MVIMGKICHFRMSVAMTANGLGIGEEWEFGKQMLISVPKFNGGKMLKCSSSAHFLPIPCYAFALFLALIFSKLETILKINQKYFEKSLQLSK